MEIIEVQYSIFTFCDNQLLLLACLVTFYELFQFWQNRREKVVRQSGD